MICLYRITWSGVFIKTLNNKVRLSSSVPVYYVIKIILMKLNQNFIQPTKYLLLVKP